MSACRFEVTWGNCGKDVAVLRGCGTWKELRCVWHKLLDVRFLEARWGLSVAPIQTGLGGLPRIQQSPIGIWAAVRPTPLHDMGHVVVRSTSWMPGTLSIWRRCEVGLDVNVRCLRILFCSLKPEALSTVAACNTTDSAHWCLHGASRQP